MQEIVSSALSDSDKIEPTARRVPKSREGELCYPKFRAVIRLTESNEYEITLNDRPSGAFKTSTAAVKWLRDKAREKFGGAAPEKDTLVNIQRLRSGTVVPTCFSKAPEGIEVAGRGLLECPTCPYRTACSPAEVAATAQPIAAKPVESEDSFIARLKAKLNGATK